MVTGEFELSFLHMQSASHVIPEVAGGLEAAGFTITPFPTTSDEDFFEVLSDPNAPVNARLSGWCPDWPSGSDWFPPVFQSDGVGNFAFFAEPEIDAEIERILGLPVEQQATAWGALDRLIMTKYYPVIFTGHPGVAIPHGSRIGGMNADDVWQIPTWKGHPHHSLTIWAAHARTIYFLRCTPGRFVTPGRVAPRTRHDPGRRR
ncbi:hypothetical protein BH18ACT8_BH18ACT8_17120 [soil metagenome]